MIFKHKSVLLEETIDSLNIKPDGTAGMNWSPQQSLSRT